MAIVIVDAIALAVCGAVRLLLGPAAAGVAAFVGGALILLLAAAGAARE